MQRGLGSSPIPCYFKLCDPEQVTPVSVAQCLCGGVMGIRQEQQFPNYSLEIWGGWTGHRVLQGSPWK